LQLKYILTFDLQVAYASYVHTVTYIYDVHFYEQTSNNHFRVYVYFIYIKTKKTNISNTALQNRMEMNTVAQEILLCFVLIQMKRFPILSPFWSKNSDL